MDLHLSGKVAVATGASRGIGLAVVRALVEEGSPGRCGGAWLDQSALTDLA